MDTDISFNLPRKTYCNIASELPTACFEISLLEVWGLKNEIIMNLTDDKVINDINNITMNAIFGYERDIISMLGGIERSSDGQMISAKAGKHIWVTTLDHTAIARGDAGIDKEGTGSTVDLSGLLFESVWVNTVLNAATNPDQTINLYAHAASSFGKVSEQKYLWRYKMAIMGILCDGCFCTYDTCKNKQS